MTDAEIIARDHIVDGEFQSDKYPTCPRGKVPLSTKDPMAQDLLWLYAQRRREIDPQFSDDLEFALREKGFTEAGLAIRPMEPTDKMVEAGVVWDREHDYYDAAECVRDTYKAMMRAGK